VFLHKGSVISWKSTKQTLIATSTNHSEIIALYEASQECVWLRRVIDHIQTLCGMGALESPTIIYEDNAACVAHADLFTKSLRLVIFGKCVKGIGMRRLKDFHGLGGRTPICNIHKMHHIVLFSFMSFTRIYHRKVFNEAMCTQVYVYLFIFYT
jgi:hypothetical protein